MAANSVSDDDKVMDVSKPGKGKVSTTSRPIVAPIVSDDKNSGSSDAVVEETKVATEEQKAPSAAHKVIQPLSDLEPSKDSGEPISVEVGDTISAEDTSAEKPADETAEKTEEPKKDDESGERPGDVPPAPDGGDSDSANVDALVASAETKKQAAKRAEEDAKKNAALQELIDSKKYFVHTSHGIATKRGARTAWVVAFAIILIAVIVSLYILADAEVVDVPFALPIDLIK